MSLQSLRTQPSLAQPEELPRTPEARAACERYTRAVARLLVKIGEQDPISGLTDLIAAGAGYELQDSDYEPEDVRGADVGDNIEIKCVVKFRARREVRSTERREAAEFAKDTILGALLSNVPIIQDYSIKRTGDQGATVVISYLGSIMTARVALSKPYTMDVRP